MEHNNASNHFTKKNLTILLFLCSLIVYGFSLPFSFKTPHFSPNNDFSNHAHFMSRFAESFTSGQIIPRTMVSPAEYADATIPTLDIPTFQYYGFFEGLVALPFHLLGMSDTTSAVLSSILIRFLGLLILFETCLLLGASPLTAFIASFSLLISPYTLTVFYGRGALAEAFAQSLLVLIPYGYALAYRGRIRHAIITFALAFFFLPLCHNIFFLYGLVFLIILALFSFRFKIILAAGIGSLLGILMSAWQWFPAQNTLKDLTIFGSLRSWKLGISGVETHSASLSGALGIPQPFFPAGLTHALPIYFTIGWWTVPFILLTLTTLFQKEKRQLALPFFICAIVFFALTFWPFNQFLYANFMPQAFGIVQTTSRLLGFLSLFGSLCFAISIPKLNPRLFQIMLVLMLASQIPVFICYFNLAAQKSWDNDSVRGAPINYYYSNPTHDAHLKTSSGDLNVDNRFYIAPEKAHHFFVRLAGYTNPSNIHVKIAIAALQQEPATKQYNISSIVSKQINLNPNFFVTIEARTTSPSGWYKIIVAPNNAAKQHLSSITLTRIDVIPNNLSNWIFQENMTYPHKIFGYSSQFQVNENQIANFKTDHDGYYTLELPVAYAKLFTVMQNGKPLQFSPDYNHRMLIRTEDLRDPIKVHYTLDYISIMLTLLGMLGFGLTLSLKKWCPSHRS